MPCPKCGSKEAEVGATRGTLMWGGSATRDANGVVHSAPDPNIYTTEYRCLKCGIRYEETEGPASRVRGL